ncbi:MAG: DUF4062 domain-containing protein [Rhodocyclaceae bacterium]|nr:DUF4062 domain-containing protein [Rhodocyclaceae bacterium]
MDTAKVFVSSTWIDLIAERQAVEQAARRLRSIQFVGMEQFGARDADTRKVSLEEVDRCQVYVGVLGWRWGSGITEAEYRRARVLELPCLIYCKSGRPVVDGQPQEDAIRLGAWLKELSATHTVSHFDSPQDLATKLVADLHNLLFHQLVVGGMGRLHADYGSRIQRFMSEYLGTSKVPVPFGGRQRELGQLERWLARADGPPYALLGGPAGRGKSALLVHWARELTRHEDLDLVYFPISIRFRTNLASVAYSSITARLAELHGEPVPAGPETPDEAWRELMASYLRRPPPPGRRLLLLIDGADEGADWQPGPDIFPSTPPDGLRVLVSARYLAGDLDAGGWLARLGWDRPRAAYSIDLAPLAPSGLVDVLRETSLPLELLSARADVVAELFRLSAGDPLLINLYVSDLWARGGEVARLQPEDLAALQPGLEGYFKRWWKEQHELWGEHESPLREPAVNAVFDALACALGPLLTAELLELLPKAQRVSVWRLDEVMQSLRRFVVGDGDVQGYCFSHPRLGDYFYDRLTQAGSELQQTQRFVAWGRRCLGELASGQRLPSDVPGYLLRYLRSHFDRAASPPADYLGLASTAWAMAWERLDRGSNSGFLSDLRRVSEIIKRVDDEHAAQQELAPYLATEWRCALGVASIASQASAMSPRLLGALVERGTWTLPQAIAFATRVPGPALRLHTSLTLVVVAQESERPLALAAAQAELRSLMAGKPELAIVQEVLVGIARDASTPPALAGALFTAVGQLAKQGLGTEQCDKLLATLEQAALYCPVSAKYKAALLDCVADTRDTPSNAVQHARRAALESLSVRLASRENPADRLRPLRRALSDGDGGESIPLQWRLAALEAAIGVLACAAAIHGELAEDGVTLLSQGWLWLTSNSPEHAAAIFEGVPRALKPAALETLLEQIRQHPRVEHLSMLEWLLRSLPASRRDRIGAHLAEVRAKVAPGAGHGPDLDEALIEVHDAALHKVLEARIAAQPAAQALHLCWRVARRGVAPALHAAMGRWALRAMEGLQGTNDGVLALEALLDLVEPPGFGDSFAGWRELQPTDTVTLEGDGPPPLGRQAKLLMKLAAAPRSELWASAQHLSRRLPERHEVARLQWLRMQRIGASLSTDSKGAPGADVGPSCARVLARLEERRLSPEDLAAEVALGERAPPSLAQMLKLLGELAGYGYAELARETVPHVLAGPLAASLFGETYEDAEVNDLLATPALAATGALWPPSEETIAALRPLLESVWVRADAAALNALMFGSTRPAKPRPVPDIVRHRVLAFALGEPGRLEAAGAQLYDVSIHIARLAHPPDGLVLRVLTALREDLSLTPSQRRDALKPLAYVLPRSALARWLEAAWRAKQHVGELLQHLHAGVIDPLPLSRQLVQAVAQVSDPRERRDWLVRLASSPSLLHLDMPWAEALPIGRALPSPPDRLAALCALLPALSREQRSEPLTEALSLAPRVPEQPGIACTLVQMAVDLGLDEPSLREQAIAAAVTIADRTLRSDAVATLVTRLDGEPLAAAVASTRRIEDAAERVRAMRACAEVCPAALRPEAAAHLRLAIEALPADALRAEALVFASPLWPPNERWPLLADALRQAPGTGTGFVASELVDALVDAMTDAPWRICDAALRWLGRWPASDLRSKALCQLLPGLPPGMRLPTVVLIAEQSSADLPLPLVADLSADEIDYALALGSRLPPTARTLLRRVSDAQAGRVRLEAPGEANVTGPAIEAQLARAANDLQRCTAICRIARGTLSPSALATAVAATRAIGDADARHTATRCLALHVGKASLPKAIEAVQDIEDAGDRSWFLIRLALRSSGSAREKLLEMGLAAAEAAPEAFDRLRAACDCALQWPLLLPKVLALMAEAAEEDLRSDALRGLVECKNDWPDRALAEWVCAVKAQLGEWRCARLLADRAETFGAAATSAALAAAACMRGGVARHRILVACAPRMTDAQRGMAVELLECLEPDFAWLEALGALSARWPAELTPARARRACDAMAQIHDPAYIGSWLQRVASAWPASEWALFVEAASALRGDALRGGVLASAIRACGTDVPAELVTAVRALRDAQQRALLLGQIALLSEPVDLYLLAQALSEANRCGHVRLRIETTVAMVCRAGIMVVPVFDALFEHFESYRLPALQAFRDVAPWLDDAMAYRLLDEVPWHRLSCVTAECSDLLCALAPAMGPVGLPTLLRASPRVCGERHGAQVLVRLAPTIGDEASQSAALETALAIRDACWRAEALIGIAAQLDAEQQRILLTALVDTPRQTERARRLLCVRPLIKQEAMQQWLAGAASISQVDLASSLPPSEAVEPLHKAPGDAAVQALDALMDELPAHSRTSAAGRPPPARVPSPGLALLCERLEALEAETDRFEALKLALPGLRSADRIALLERLPAHFGPDRLDQALMKIAPGLTGADSRVLVAELGRIEEPARLCRLIRGLHLQTADDMRSAFLQSLRKGLDAGVRTDRPALVRLLCAWAPATIQIGCEDAPLQLIKAIDEVGRMWP